MRVRSTYPMRNLRFTDDDIQQHGQLQFKAETAAHSPYAKFEVEPSSSVRGLVHLRSCYNNKYWVRTSPTQMWIAAHSDIPEEDQSKWSCTLFSPTYLFGRDHYFRFRHVQLDQNVCILPEGQWPFTDFLFVRTQSSNQMVEDMFVVTDWESLLVLPRHVVFKGDNGRFLRARVIERSNYLEFSGTSNTEATARNEVFENPDGSVRIRSNHYGRFWRRSPNFWIWGDSTDTTANNMDTVFWPERVGPNVVALRLPGTLLYCKRLTDGGKTSCLSAADYTITVFGRLEVGEWVRKRSISNVRFRLLDARIYGQVPRTLARTTVRNNTAHTNTPVIRFRYRNTISRHWQSTVSFSYGLSSTVSAGIPLFTDASLTVQWELSSEYTWGQTIETSEEQEQEYPVTVGPYSMATITFQATQGFCDVPFSYTQTDELFDGRIVPTEMHDGLYTGANLYEFHWENTEESLLPADEIKLAEEDVGVGKKKEVELKVELGEAEIVDGDKEE
ncbi:unnamed protein product [Linum tenue]|uniref:Agglutinin domain-containing protein n=1 Tax=Linum tenue TaxID=586396 RepID=A0AAV0RII9_9ROSI|nr:unnamed protein product [Linum tenue]